MTLIIMQNKSSNARRRVRPLLITASSCLLFLFLSLQVVMVSLTVMVVVPGHDNHADDDANAASQGSMLLWSFLAVDNPIHHSSSNNNNIQKSTTNRHSSSRASVNSTNSGDAISTSSPARHIANTFHNIKDNENDNNKNDGLISGSNLFVNLPLTDLPKGNKHDHTKTNHGSTSPTVMELLNEPLPQSCRIHVWQEELQPAIPEDDDETTNLHRSPRMTNWTILRMDHFVQRQRQRQESSNNPDSLWLSHYHHHHHAAATTSSLCSNYIVTAYFPTPSKHSPAQYQQWMAYLLSVPDCLIVFTSSEMVETIKQLRQQEQEEREQQQEKVPSNSNATSSRTSNNSSSVATTKSNHFLATTELPSPPTVPERQSDDRPTILIEFTNGVDDLPLAKLGHEFWERQLNMDPEKDIHQSYPLFCIWLSKSWFVVQSIQLLESLTDQAITTRVGKSTGSSNKILDPNSNNKALDKNGVFMWQDIGAFRGSRYQGQRILVHTNVIPSNSTILWQAHHRPNPPPTPLWNDKFGEPRHYFHSGSQGVGRASAWNEFHQYMGQTLHQFVQHDMFLGEDQCLLQSTCQLHPHVCAYISFREIKDHRYRGLRYVLVHGGNYTLWRMPSRPLSKIG